MIVNTSKDRANRVPYIPGCVYFSAVITYAVLICYFSKMVHYDTAAPEPKFRFKSKSKSKVVMCEDSWEKPIFGENERFV